MADQERSLSSPVGEEDSDLRRGPWTEEEDAILVNYVSLHGDSSWNSIARSSGLKRTGKSCRLRWLNYLRPDVRRGNITLQEQFLILKLHSLWGNRWSKIAQHLPGRTDNEIKNYWRTRVHKQAKQLKCDVNSKLFKDTMRNVWMPRLLERIQAQSSASSFQTERTANTDPVQYGYVNEPAGSCQPMIINQQPSQYMPYSEFSSTSSSNSPETQVSTFLDPDDGSGMVNGLGIDPGDSGFRGFNDWGCDGDIWKNLWNDDSFSLLQDRFHDETSYSYSYSCDN